MKSQLKQLQQKNLKLFMTKILYITTGRYLLFDNRCTGTYTADISEEQISAEDCINSLTSLNIRIGFRHILQDWIELNNIQFPIHREELQVIYG